MSTYYYIVCDEHLERTDACSKGYGGIGRNAHGDSEETLGPFIATHCGCPVRIVSEHEDDAYSELFEDWTSENIAEMLGKHENSKTKSRNNQEET